MDTKSTMLYNSGEFVSSNKPLALKSNFPIQKYLFLSLRTFSIYWKIVGLFFFKGSFLSQINPEGLLNINKR